MSGVEADIKVSELMPRFLEYHSVVLGIDFTVRTRWSRAVIFAAGLEKCRCGTESFRGGLRARAAEIDLSIVRSYCHIL